MNEIMSMKGKYKEKTEEKRLENHEADKKVILHYRKQEKEYGY